MKAWKLFVLIGGSLLLADISTVLTSTDGFTEGLHRDSPNEPNGMYYFVSWMGFKICGTRLQLKIMIKIQHQQTIIHGREG